MTKRKLGLNGCSTTISIPRVMLEHIDRRAGDYVNLTIKGDTIIITAAEISKSDMDTKFKDLKYCNVCTSDRSKCIKCHNQSQYANDTLGL